MKLLLTSGGVTNPSIHDGARRDARQADRRVRRALSSRPRSTGTRCAARTSAMALRPPSRRLRDLVRPGLESRVGVLELTALPSHRRRSAGSPWVRETDVLLVDGGDATYLCHWMRESGLADLLPSLPDTVWVGVSAGQHGDDPAHRGGLRRVAAVRAGRPHPRRRRLLDLPAPGTPSRTTGSADAQRWAADIAGPAYAIDDQTAITVVDGTVEVISEGEWTAFGL